MAGRRTPIRHGSPGLKGSAMNARDPTAGALVNALSIDVEDYFQVSAFAAHVPRSRR